MYMFTAVDHVGVAVSDLDAATVWYREHLGLDVVHREINHDQGVVEVMLRASPDDVGAQLQLLAPTSPESPIARFLKRSGPGMHHIAYQVPEIGQASEELRSRGQRLLYDEARPGTLGSRINFIHPKDTGGVLVELVEHS
jgi:methylmalonyl-CoA/ethylmalonyl-CoA epimerase